MENKNYNLYLLAIPAEQDDNTAGILTQVNNVRYALCAQTNKIDEQVLCKLMKEMYRAALEVQNGD